MTRLPPAADGGDLTEEGYALVCHKKRVTGLYQQAH